MSRAAKQPCLGIIGGMGPDATVALMQRVIGLTPASDDVDHIRMLVDNNPKIPSRLRAILEGDGEDPTPVLTQMAQGLAQAGADFLVIPCNTAHYYHPAIAAAVDIPVWHLIDMTAQHLRDLGVQKVALLGSSAVRKIALFEPFFAQHGVNLHYPDANCQDAVMTVIRAVKAGNLSDEQFALYLEQISQLHSAGVDCWLLGCSELSVLGARHPQDLAVVDALQIQAQAIVTHCLGA